VPPELLTAATWLAGFAAGPARAARLLDVGLSPDPGDLPGGATLQQLTNGIAGWALILSLVALVIGAAAWALGAHSQNYHQSFVGRRAVLVSGLAALLIGAAPTLINFFWHTGTGLH
jgi:MFS family permease